MPFKFVEIIRGCKDDADGRRPLMTRLHLLHTPWFRIYLHTFHRSDEDRELHDHPWSFFSLILWRGYDECRPVKSLRNQLEGGDTSYRVSRPGVVDRVRVWPGSIIYRPAWWAHRVELPPGKKSVSLVVALRYSRHWGFFTENGWQYHRDFHTERGCE